MNFPFTRLLDEAGINKKCLELCDDVVRNASGAVSGRRDGTELENPRRCTIDGPQSINKPKDSHYSKAKLKNKIAMEFGNEKEHSEWVRKLDKKLKVQSFYAIKAIKEGGNYDWDSIVSVMNNSDKLIKVPNSHKHNSDSFKIEETAYFKIDGSPDRKKVQQIQAWFKKCIDDVDASMYENSTLVNQGVIERLAEIASETGARIRDIETFFEAEQSRSGKALEISIIRFPDKENPHVKLYRIKIFSWYKSVRTYVAIQKDKAGFEFECDVMEFKLVDGWVEKIKHDQLNKIAEQLNDPDTFDF